MSHPALSSHAAIPRPSPTLAITARANAMTAEGIDVVAFAAGEPDFDTPVEVRVAAAAAMDSGFTKYTPTPGILALRQAIAQKCRDFNRFDVKPEQIVVSCGAKHSLFNAIWATVSPGDEVIVIAPFWMTYRDQIQIAGGTVRVVSTTMECGFVPSVEAVQAAITPNTKAILINSPSNPTGAVYPEDVLRGIADLAARHGLWIIADEIYERLIYEGRHVSIASLGPQASERTITISGCSKSFSMTGWRIGYMAAPIEVAMACSRFQDQVTSSATSFAQMGALKAFQMDGAEMEAMRKEFEERRALMGSLLAAIPKLRFRPPAGAFYFFVDARELCGDKDGELAEAILHEAHVALIPGSVFEAPGFLRLSCTASKSRIEEGMARLKKYLSSC